MQVRHNNFIQLIIIVVSLFFGYRAFVTVVDLWQRRGIVDSAKKQYLKLTQDNQELATQLKTIQSPQYVEQVAREKFGFVKDGEAIVLLQGSGDRVQGTEATENLPNWKKWWKLFF